MAVITIGVMVFAASICAAQEGTLVFSDVFEDPDLPGISASQGYVNWGFGSYFMRIPIGPITLNLDGLPEHTLVTFKFLLAVIDSWDGLTGAMSPDYVRVTADGQIVFNGAFDNTYPADQSADVTQYATPLVYGQKLAYTSIFKDSAYYVSVPFSHSAAALSVTWRPVWKGVGFLDESFAIDSIEVWVDVPAPAGMAASLPAGGVTGTWVLPHSLGGNNK
jgi:hypothetical protein